MTDEFEPDQSGYGPVYHAPIHHRALTPSPVVFGVTDDDAATQVFDASSEPVVAPNEAFAQAEEYEDLRLAHHQFPSHPDPVHHRPVHVSGIAAANQMMTQQPQYPYGAQNPQCQHLQDAQHPVAQYPVAQKRPNRWAAAITSAILAAILASVGTAAWLTYDPLNLNPGASAPASQQPSHLFPAAPAAPGPVDNSTATNPYWQGVHAAVSGSVVAIQAMTTGGGSVGSGFIIDDAGHVLTNNHVIANANNGQVQVTLADGRLYHATVVGGDTFTDLAVVKLQNPPSDLHPVALGDSDALFVGDPVLAIGNPLGLANTATTGVISAINRPVTATGQDGTPETVTNAIQIDAAINPGNSGGPLFDHQGRVIGVTSSIASLSGLFGGASGSIGLGFAIPINLARNISAQLIENGVAQHPRLGVSLQPEIVIVDGVSRRGARIAQVVEGTAADAAGLQVGDVVIAMNGLPVGGSDSLTGFVRERSVGDQIELSVVRDGRLLTISAILGAMPNDVAVAVPDPELTLPPLQDEGADTEDESWLDEYGNPQESESHAPSASRD